MRNARLQSRWAAQQNPARPAAAPVDGIPAENLYIGQSVRLTVDLVPDGDSILISHHYRSRLGDRHSNQVLALTRDQALALMARIHRLLNLQEIPVV